MITKVYLHAPNCYRVTFELPADLDADTVHLVADFTDWHPIPFQKHADGRWTLVQTLPAGHRYRFHYRVTHHGHSIRLDDPDADAPEPGDDDNLTPPTG